MTDDTYDLTLKCAACGDGLSGYIAAGQIVVDTCPCAKKEPPNLKCCVCGEKVTAVYKEEYEAFHVVTCSSCMMKMRNEVLEEIAEKIKDCGKAKADEKEPEHSVLDSVLFIRGYLSNYWHRSADRHGFESLCGCKTKRGATSVRVKDMWRPQERDMCQLCSGIQEKMEDSDHDAASTADPGNVLFIREPGSEYWHRSANPEGSKALCGEIQPVGAKKIRMGDKVAWPGYNNRCPKCLAEHMKQNQKVRR